MKKVTVFEEVENYLGFSINRTVSGDKVVEEWIDGRNGGAKTKELVELYKFIYGGEQEFKLSRDLDKLERKIESKIDTLQTVLGQIRSSRLEMETK